MGSVGGQEKTEEEEREVYIHDRMCHGRKRPCRKNEIAKSPRCRLRTEVLTTMVHINFRAATKVQVYTYSQRNEGIEIKGNPNGGYQRCSPVRRALVAPSSPSCWMPLLPPLSEFPEPQLAIPWAQCPFLILLSICFVRKFRGNERLRLRVEDVSLARYKYDSDVEMPKAMVKLENDDDDTRIQVDGG